MTRFQLATLVSWASPLKTRKRLQKVVFMLQAAGCRLDTDFTLHHYGPYSEDLARLTDEMVRQGFLEEQEEENGRGKQYSYRLPAPVQRQLDELEKSERGRELAEALVPFELQAKELLAADLKTLEYASTISFFRSIGDDWDAAVKSAAAFKHTLVPVMKTALPLAKQMTG